MRFFLNEVLAQLKGIWNRLDGGQRLVVSAVMLATIVGLGAIVWFAGQPSYETVFDARSKDDIAQFRQAMQQAGVSYQIDDDGRTFRVERSKVGLAQMALAEAGLNGTNAPSLGGGLSIIEDAETKAWKLDAASRAQAATAISALDGVQSVTVTASRPRRTAAFRDRDAENRASATVVLRLKPGAAFEPLARSAASLASSQLMVPLENIEIVSAAGNNRWHHDPDREAGGGSSEFLNLQRGMSDNRTRMAQDRLDQLWPGKTSVSVSLELDPSWEIRSEKVVPEEQIVRSEKFTKDSSNASGPKAAEDNKNTSKNETRDREFVTEIGERRTGRMAPDIKRMTVAVLYDRSLEQATGFNKEDLVAAVKAIVGWNPERDKPEAFSTLVGDFAPVELEATGGSGPGLADTLLRWGPTIGQVLGVLVVVLFLRGLFKRSGGRSGRASRAAEDAGAPPEASEEDLPPDEHQKRMRREIERSIASDPAALAKMLEAWLMEQKA
ncbi:MAG TPA: flagellar M-ring protein FliF C-terminal domain-containing protein [Planctomycetota bacterium]|nr:flagellar M-ring protein FliF C-terminal domain-containing protein [Planctomycetota bacterium]